MPVSKYTSLKQKPFFTMIPHKLGFSEISSPQSLLPSNLQILNLILINLIYYCFLLCLYFIVCGKINKIKNKK